MGHTTVAAVALLGMGAAGYALRPAGAPESASAVVDVSVTGNCANPDSSSVNPDPVDVNQGDDIDWTLSGDADSLEISPKTAAWPYAARQLRGRRPAAPPGQARAAAVARARGMRADQAGNRFGYNVTVYCGTDSHVIDPDIIVH